MKIQVNNTIYSREAITAALYQLSGDYYVSQDTLEGNPSVSCIDVEPKNGELPQDFEKELLNILNDFQLRCDLDNRFGKIRDQLVEEAFKPITRPEK